MDRPAVSPEFKMTGTLHEPQRARVAPVPPREPFLLPHQRRNVADRRADRKNELRIRKQPRKQWKARDMVIRFGDVAPGVLNIEQLADVRGIEGLEGTAARRRVQSAVHCRVVATREE